MPELTQLAVKDHDGNERPALLIARHIGIGDVVDWMRTGRQEIVHPDRTRVVSDPQEWDLACEFDAFAAPCFKCGQVKADPRPYALCGACVKAEREPQGQAVRLFEPAPTQIAGQLTL